MLWEGGLSRFGSHLAALYPTSHRFQRFQHFWCINSGKFRIYIIYKSQDGEVQICSSDQACRVCARPLVFLLACRCSVLLNAGRSCGNSPQRVLIVLVLSCCGNGSKSEARATPVDCGRPGIVIWLNPGVVPPPTPTVALRCITALGRGPVYVNGRICFGSGTPMCMGDHESL